MPIDTLHSAQMVASTLSFLSREITGLGPPFNMWTPEICPRFISELAGQVGRGELYPLWVTEKHPEQGLILYAPAPWESRIFGWDCARCLGPFLAPVLTPLVGEGDSQLEREARSRSLARQVAEMAQSLGHQLVSAKVFHDPAVLRGFLAENFILAEIGASLVGDISDKKIVSPELATLPPNFNFLAPGEIGERALGTVESLGDFFYDGHFRHDPIPGPLATQKFWSQVLLDDLTGQADPAVVLWDKDLNHIVGVATVRSVGDEALLNVLTVSKHYRQRGLGRLLMQETLSRLAGRFSRLRVETASYNLAALKLYQGLGFKASFPLAALHYHHRI